MQHIQMKIRKCQQTYFKCGQILSSPQIQLQVLINGQGICVSRGISVTLVYKGQGAKVAVYL